MKEGLIELLKEIGGNKISRDLYYCISGIFMLLVLNFLFQPAQDFYPNWAYFSSLAKGVSIFILSYFLARLCNEIGILLTNSMYFFFKKDKLNSLKRFLEKIIERINSESVSIKRDSVISDTELEYFIDSKGASILYERKIQNLILEEIFLGFSVILFFYYSPYIIFITILLLLKTVLSDNEISDHKHDVASFMISEK